MFQVESQQLVENVAAFTQAGMAKDLAAGNHVIRDAAEAQADFDMALARILAGGLPRGGELAEVTVAQHQVVGNAEDDGAEGAVGAANERAVGAIDAVALVA